MATSSAKNRLQFNIRSIRFRLAVLFIGIFTFNLLVLSLLVYTQFKSSRAAEFDRSLYNYAVDVAHSINIGASGHLTYDIESFLGGGKSFPFAIGRSFIQLARIDGTLIAKSRDLEHDVLPLPQPVLMQVLEKRFVFQNVSPKEIPTALKETKTRYRLLSLLVNPGIQSNFILQIAVPMTFLDQEALYLLQLFYVAIPVSLIISLFGGIYLSGRAFAPIQLIIEKAQHLNPARLDERLPLPTVDDELRALSVTLNELFDRIQTVFHAQERFVADASHQLKTPLAILRGELDIALQKKRSPEELEELMVSLSQELTHLSKIVDDLLVLARIDAGVSLLSKKEVRIDELAMDAVSRLEKLARSRNVSIKMDLRQHEAEDPKAFQVFGDDDLIKSMITEIIGNGIKYSQTGQTVDVSVEDEKDFAVISVKDSGRGVPEKDREKIFERFYRSSNPDVQGSGLGLSISKKIAEVHGGTIEYTPRPEGGSAFLIRIKKS